MRDFGRLRLGMAAVLALCVVAMLSALVTVNAGFAAPFLAKADVAQSEPIVVLETNKGTIKIKVFTGEAPKTGNNFVDLVKRGFYNGLSFHRYEPGFVIQGGDPNGNGTGGFTDPQTGKERTIPLEKNPKLNHDSAGVVAMARSANPNSASSQFYITLKPASFLDNPPGYAVFGHVTDGMSVVMELRAGDKMNKVFVEEAKSKKSK